jgi:hypothetical protein
LQASLLRFGRAVSGESGIGRRNRYAPKIERAASQGAHVAFTNVDRLVFAGLYRLALDAVKTLKLESTSTGG